MQRYIRTITTHQNIIQARPSQMQQQEGLQSRFSFGSYEMMKFFNQSRICERLLYSLMSSHYQTAYKCNICLKIAQQPVNLKCSHHPCYSCANSIQTIDPTSKIEVKYQLNCPTCTKKTVFYDLRHLIITKNEYDDQQTFVTNKFINKAQAKMIIQPQNNYVQGESQLTTRRGSIQSIANVMNKAGLDVRCREHKEAYKYFCCDCFDEQRENCFVLCNACATSHYNQGHRLISIKQAQTKILDFSMIKHQEINKKYDQINIFAQQSTKARQFTQQTYKKLEESLSQQFKSIFQTLNKKYHEMKDELKQSYEESLKMIDGSMDEIVECKQVLSELRGLEVKDMESSLKFYQSYYGVKLEAIQKFKINISTLPLINKRLSSFQGIAQEISHLHLQLARSKVCEHKRRQSQQDNQLSNRSNSQKQNKKTIDSQDSKYLFKKLFA